MVDRGDRLRPSRTHHARTVLVLLADAARRVAEALPRAEGRRMLDMGCGNMPYRHLFAERGWTYVGADFAGNPDAALTLAADGSLPPGAGAFDGACSFQV